MITLAILLSNSYKGKVFELISISSYPWTPKSLQDIIDSNYVITTVSRYVYESKRKMGSFIRYQVEETVRKYPPGSKHRFLKYQQLLDKLIFSAGVSMAEYCRNLLKHGVTYSQKENEITAEPELVEVTDPFVFLDFLDFVEVLKKLTIIWTNKTYIAGEKLPFFTSRRNFVTDQEWYAALIAPYYASYVESGIYARWVRYDEVMFMFIILRNILDSAMSQLLTGKEIGKLQMLEPMKIDTFWVLVTPVLYLVGLAALVSLLEVNWDRIRKIFHHEISDNDKI